MKHIDKVFRDKLYNQKATVPDGLWDKIAPALEEKSARSILWFWFAGILTLLIGGIGYLLFSDYQASTPTSTPLAIETPLQSTQSSTSLSKTLALSSESPKTELVELPKSIKSNSIKTTINRPKQKNITPVRTKVKAKASVNKSIIIDNVDRSNAEITVSNIETVNTDNLYGKPANLVITKSYLSDNGSIIEKSDLSNDTKKSEPSYNVFINSAGRLNAGALLRIIEPLENIPLPAFSTGLKKKITL